ncbi:hypothetical protein FPJ27_37170 (plasmid) [Burkholderia sp. MS455]|nr:hypothetical protein FPJ27_37170 [Burkholderia sp. MS455]
MEAISCLVFPCSKREGLFSNFKIKCFESIIASESLSFTSPTPASRRPLNQPPQGVADLCITRVLDRSGLLGGSFCFLVGLHCR